MPAPKRKRLKKHQRLQDSKRWIFEFKGKNLVKSYKKWYGVDIICAINELEMMGYDFSQYKKEAKRQLKIEQQKKEERKREKEINEREYYEPWQDENFYYIAGYTSGGAPYGVTWEEYKGENDYDKELMDNERFEKDDDGEVPF